MAITHVFAVRDNKAGMYHVPFCAQNAVIAARMLNQAVNDPNTQLSMFPEDFDLFQVGEFDDVAGKLEALTAPVFIVGCISFKKLTSQEEKNGKTNID